MRSQRFVGIVLGDAECDRGALGEAEQTWIARLDQSAISALRVAHDLRPLRPQGGDGGAGQHPADLIDDIPFHHSAAFLKSPDGPDDFPDHSSPSSSGVSNAASRRKCSA